jgi:SnoaL-like domain
MKLLLRLVLVGALIALAVWVWTILFPSPQQVILRRLVKLAQLASFSPNEGNIARVANVERMGALFSEDVQVVIGVPGVETHTFNGREELMQAALYARAALTSLKAEFPDIQITLGPDRQSAAAEVTLEAKASGQSDLIIQELKFTFERRDGAWRIARVDTVRTLRQ